MIQTHEQDECCYELLIIATAEDRKLMEWECPNCGMKWKARFYGGESVKHWSQYPVIELINL